MSSLTRSVFVTFRFVGFHLWPEAPQSVAYLRSRHRHLFMARVDISVDSDNRSIEYHMLKRQLLEAFTIDNDQNEHGEFEFGAKSCEQLAQRILDDLRELYPLEDFYRVEVSEDGENGSVVVA